MERQLSIMCQNLDNHLEDMYGTKFRLHPNRMERGSGSNPSFDGLFSTSCAFTLGYGSRTGRGYLVNVDIRTLDWVSMTDKAQILDEAYDYLVRNIDRDVPGRKLGVVKENNLIKIVGDFSLGEV